MASKKTVYATGNGKGNGDGTANLGFEQKLWLAADKLRGNMDASEYKHVILGLIFLKYISDSFESRLPAELRVQISQGAKLDKLILANLEDIGYGK